MGEIVRGKFGDFTQKKVMVYRCPFCENCQWFNLMEDGVLLCQACSSRQYAPDSWVMEAWKYVPDDPEEHEEGELDHPENDE